MYILARDSDLNFLNSQRIIQVCVGENEVIFNFDNNYSITVYSKLSFTQSNIQAFTLTADTAGMASLGYIGELIVDYAIDKYSNLVLVFASSKRMAIIAESQEYENYIIRGNSTIVVV